MTSVKYREGDWFAVPLGGGGFAVGIVARANPRGALLGYFFGPRRAEFPEMAELAELRPTEAALIGTFSYLGIKRGEWPLLGRLEGWDRSEWPMPVFVRYEELTGRSFHVFYDDDDPAKFLREERIPPGSAEQGPRDSAMGAGYVEELLTDLLGSP